MFKILLPFWIAFISFPLHAVQLTVQNPCLDTYWLDEQVSAQVGQNVGDVSVSTFQKAALPFDGTPSGIRSIGNTPIGNDAVEVINDKHMRAYGWCFSLNGVEPSDMPDQVVISSTDDIIRWYFGFAEYKDGNWISYCTPTHLVRPDFICRN